jgi:hypothetical protein
MNRISPSTQLRASTHETDITNLAIGGDTVRLHSPALAPGASVQQAVSPRRARGPNGVQACRPGLAARTGEQRRHAGARRQGTCNQHKYKQAVRRFACHRLRTQLLFQFVSTFQRPLPA